MLIAFLLIGLHFDLIAQCAMCRAATGSNMANGGNAGGGLNTGILYMLLLPYTLVFVIGYIWWKKNKEKSI